MGQTRQVYASVALIGGSQGAWAPAQQAHHVSPLSHFLVEHQLNLN